MISTEVGVLHGVMSPVQDMKTEVLYQTLADASRLDVVVIIGNVAAGPPAQLHTNRGFLT